MNKQIKIVIPLGIGWHIPASWTMVDWLMKTKQTSGPQIIETTAFMMLSNSVKLKLWF